MKLNQECMLSVLSYLEEKLVVKLDGKHPQQDSLDYIITKVASWSIIKDEYFNGKYTKEELFYATVQLVNFGLIRAKSSTGSNNQNQWDILDILPDGHMFLEKKKLFI